MIKTLTIKSECNAVCEIFVDLTKVDTVHEENGHACLILMGSRERHHL
jgi:hypothetical protein